MPNIKFSDFTAEADINNFEGVVGFTTDVGGVNYKIQPLQMPARYDAAQANIALGDSATLLGTNIANAGIGNLAIGFETLGSLDPASGQKLGASIAIGNGALTSITETGPLGTGQQIAIGESAQALNGSIGGVPSADENVALGYNALGSNTGDYSTVGFPEFPGNFNTAIGGRSLEDLDGGGSNTALGHNSGFTLFEGSANTLVGFEVGANAGSGLSMLNETGVTAIGWQAMSQGDYSVVIGYDTISKTNVGATTPDYSITIGHQAVTDTPKAILVGSDSTSEEAPNSILIGHTSSITLDPALYSDSQDILIGDNSTVTVPAIQVYSGTFNTSIGNTTDITGSYNVHTGYWADLVGDQNTSSGIFNTIYGDFNCGLGAQSYIGALGIPSNYNIAIGGYTQTAPGTTGSILIGIGANSTIAQGALEIGFGGTNALGSATNDIVLIGANGGGFGASQINLAADLSITTGTGTLQVGDFQAQGNSQFTGPVNINNQVFVAVQGTTATTPVSPDFTNGNIITWDIVGDVDIDNPTIPVIAGGTTAGTYIMIMKNPGAHTISLLGASWKWQGGAVAFPGVTGTAILTWVGDGTDFYGTIAQNFS